jgi:putative nucleotidyltransferase with HDIG domain
MSENQSVAPPSEEVVLAVNIPPRPALYMALQREIQKDDPDVRKISELINRDVSMASRLLETTNSAFFATRRQVTSVQDAISMIGMDQTTAVMAGLITKQSLARGSMMMARFWDVSEKRAKGMSYLAKQLKSVKPELAYSFGLFCDIGIPLLKATFPEYGETLSIANHKGDTEFLDVEHVRHDGLDHAYVGAILAQQWGIDEDVVAAIGQHHNHDILYDEAIPVTTRALVAMNYVVEKAIQEFRDDPESLEWEQGGATALEALDISAADVDEICEAIKERLRH